MPATRNLVNAEGIYQGDPYDQYIVIKYRGAAYDVTESDWVAQIREKPNTSLDALATFDVTFETVAVFDRDSLDPDDADDAALLAALDGLEETDPVLHLHLDGEVTAELRPGFPYYDIEEVGVDTRQRGRIEVRGDVSEEVGS